MREYHNQHLIHDLTQQFFAEYLNGVKGLTEIAVNEPNKLFLKVKGRWEKREPKISPRFYVSTSKSIIKALINMHSFEIQLSPIG
ncbi:hypothetical protein [Proteus mirabilis]|uniref:hypothetical protein n=1 Tax=Proteus mirabilis TaxID=584 RepID=UPI003896B107